MSAFPSPDVPFIVKRLCEPLVEPDIVLDTDTYNEIDDQFALAYAALAPGIHLRAVYAAPFHNKRSNGPADGMQKSYEEIGRVFDRLKGRAKALPGTVLRGSTSYLPDAVTPVESDAARDLVERARARTDSPLVVVAIGAITNVASALLLDPSIRDRIIVVWLGGHPPYWHTAREFNLMQDIPAAQVILDSGVPFVQIPCKNVAEHLRVTREELAGQLKGKNSLCDYLTDITCEHMDQSGSLSKVVWDISAVAWVLNRALVPTQLLPSPRLTRDCTWSLDGTRHPILIASDVNRDGIFRSLYGMLTGTPVA